MKPIAAFYIFILTLLRLKSEVIQDPKKYRGCSSHALDTLTFSLVHFQRPGYKKVFKHLYNFNTLLSAALNFGKSRGK